MLLQAKTQQAQDNPIDMEVSKKIIIRTKDPPPHLTKQPFNIHSHISTVLSSIFCVQKESKWVVTTDNIFMQCTACQDNATS